jgi:hypothetical protein
MNEPRPDEYFTPSADLASIIAQANREIAYAKYREAVEAEKIRLLTTKPLWQKLFPFRLTIERI